MTAISYLASIHNGSTTNGPVTVTIPTSTGANKRMAFFVYHAESSNSGLVLNSSPKYDSAGTNVDLTFVGRSEYSAGTVNEVVEIWRLPEASIQAGAKTISWTVTGTPTTARQSVVTFDGVDQTTPVNGSRSASVVAATTVSADVVVNTDGGALAAITLSADTPTHTWTGSSFTELVDGAMATSASRSIAYRIASGDITATTTISEAATGRLFVIGINADGLTSPIDITDVNAGSAMLEGQTSIAIVGTGLDSAGGAARIRIVGTPATHQNMGSYSASTAIAATAAVPTLTSLPYSQNAAGIGLTTWDLEAIGTATAGNDGSPVAVEIRPQSGYDVVEIASPDLSSQSLLSFLGWTAIATDLVEWDASVTVDGTPVTITVNDDGTVSLDSGGSPMPSSVTFQWRAWSSVDKLWTSYADATFGEGGIDPEAPTVTNRILTTVAVTKQWAGSRGRRR